MTDLAIGDFCETGSGGTPSRSKQNEYYDGGTIPWVKSGELARSVVDTAEEYITEKGLSESSAKLVQPGAILIAMYGATVGQVSRLAMPAATNQAICHVYPDAKLCDPDYLYRVLKGAKDKLLAKRVGGGQPNISQKILRDLQILLPPLAEQKRIAAILEAADALRAKRRESLAQLDTLLQSTFLDMFGDPVTNPKGWEVKRLKEISTNILSGTTPKGGKQVYVEEGIIFFRSQNVWKNRLLLDDVAYIDNETHLKMKKSILKNKDILMTKTGRINTENSSLGRAAMFLGQNNSANINGHVYLIRLQKDIIHEYRAGPRNLNSAISG